MKHQKMPYRSFLDKFRSDSGRFSEHDSDYLDSVCRDVEALLNTRQSSCMKQLASLNLDNSLLGYGLSDLSQYDPYSAQDQTRISQAIVLALHHFESRLHDIQAKVITPEKSDAGMLSIHIQAILIRPDSHEPVFFISEFNRLEGHFTIGKSHG